MRRLLTASLVLAVAAVSGGCYEFQTFVHSPFGPGTLCDTTHCGGCGPGDCAPCGCEPCGCGPVHYGRGPCDAPYYGIWGFGPTWGCGPLASCEPRCAPGAGCGDCCGVGPDCGCSAAAPCGDCGPACDTCCGCDPCDGGCSCGCCCGPGPLWYVLRLFRPACWFGCYNNGCGEIYWGDFHGDPPDCCDPCNCMGEFTGCTSGGCADCGCGGAPGGNYGMNYGAPAARSSSAPEAIDPGQAAQPTKAPVLPSARDPYYSSQRQRRSRARY